MRATSLSRRQSGNRRKAHSYRYSAKADGLFWVDSGQQRALGGMTDIGALRKLSERSSRSAQRREQTFPPPTLRSVRRRKRPSALRLHRSAKWRLAAAHSKGFAGCHHAGRGLPAEYGLLARPLFLILCGSAAVRLLIFPLAVPRAAPRQ